MKRPLMALWLVAVGTAAMAQDPVPRLSAPSTLPPLDHDGHRLGYFHQPLLLSAGLLPNTPIGYALLQGEGSCHPAMAAQGGIDWQALPPYESRYAPQRLPPAVYWLGR